MGMGGMNNMNNNMGMMNNNMNNNMGQNNVSQSCYSRWSTQNCSLFFVFVCVCVVWLVKDSQVCSSRAATLRCK
jgi:hypothetical protein